jgi:TRAP-type C4-dicarboxylate transport system permease small subunit
MRILEDINDRIDRIVKWIIIVAMIIIPGVMTLQVVIRYVFNYPLSWAEESVRYTFIWLVFMSACAALRRGELIATDFVITRLPPRLAYGLTLISRVSILLFLAVAAFSGYDMTTFVLKRGTLSAVMQVPIWIVYGAMPVGCTLMGYQIVLNLIHQIRGTTPRPAAGGAFTTHD